jgi:molecular chaperone IbpA
MRYIPAMVNKNGTPIRVPKDLALKGDKKMTRLTTLDLPSFHRATVGFDRIFNEIERQFANSPNTNNYPPYNVAEINENEWMISIAVAGFGMDLLDIVHDKNILTVEGTPPQGDEEVKYLHKGIAGRAFRRSFTLADFVEVAGATLELGMLNIHLKRNVPEELQPKKIAIKVPHLIEV